MSELSRREDFATTEVIRPAAVLSESAARHILAGLAEDDVRDEGCWLTSPGVWERYDRPWAQDAKDSGDALHLGTVRSIYDSPQRYFVTIFRVSITPAGLQAGWTVDSLCDDALKHASLTLADCPRAALSVAPLPFRLEDQPLEDQPLEDQPLEDQPLEDQPLEDQPLEGQPLEDQPLEGQPL
jgi:hypothetical protein